MGHEDLPQTVGEALREGWQFLTVRCAYCRRSARIPLSKLRPRDRLASVLSCLRCASLRCQGKRTTIAAMIGYEHIHIHEKSIGVEGLRVFKIGMT